MKDSENGIEEYFDIEDIRKYMALSAEKKLIYLQEANNFFAAAIPQENKKAWEELKKNGW